VGSHLAPFVWNNFYLSTLHCKSIDHGSNYHVRYSQLDMAQLSHMLRQTIQDYKSMNRDGIHHYRYNFHRQDILPLQQWNNLFHQILVHRNIYQPGIDHVHYNL
jgi:hypothetical protein